MNKLIYNNNKIQSQVWRLHFRKELVKYIYVYIYIYIFKYLERALQQNITLELGIEIGNPFCGMTLIMLWKRGLPMHIKNSFPKGNKRQKMGFRCQTQVCRLNFEKELSIYIYIYIYT